MNNAIRNIRWVGGTIVYLFVVFILLVIFHFKFAGFSGAVSLFILAFLSHALVDYVLNKITKKKKKENDIHV